MNLWMRLAAAPEPHPTRGNAGHPKGVIFQYAHCSEFAKSTQAPRWCRPAGNPGPRCESLHHCRHHGHRQTPPCKTKQGYMSSTHMWSLCNGQAESCRLFKHACLPMTNVRQGVFIQRPLPIALNYHMSALTGREMNPYPSCEVGCSCGCWHYHLLPPGNLPAAPPARRVTQPACPGRPNRPPLRNCRSGKGLTFTCQQLMWSNMQLASPTAILCMPRTCHQPDRRQCSHDLIFRRGIIAHLP